MKPGVIQGATVIAGAKQGYLGLPLRPTQVNCTVNGPETLALQSAWYPTVDEIMAMFEGAPVILTAIGPKQQPVMLEVGQKTDATPMK
jgi:hypothetical protein